MTGFSHKPIRPVRDLMPEQVFASSWWRLMHRAVEIDDYSDYEGPANGYRLACILGSMQGQPTERLSQVCASVVTWLGTNCGNCFLHAAKRIADAKVPGIRYPYLAAWSDENKREHWLNSGLRLIEHVLAEKMTHQFGGFGLTAVQPILAVTDYEAAECLMCWLSSPDGFAFLQGCEVEIRNRRALAARQAEIDRLQLPAYSLRRLGLTREDG